MVHLYCLKRSLTLSTIQRQFLQGCHYDACSASKTPRMSHRSLSRPSSSTAGSTDYATTLQLPKSEFKVKANLEKEQVFYEHQQENEIYLPQRVDESRPKFTLLDGPPFANGSLHIGHALNKIIKDMVLRYKMLQGYSVRLLPGWDVHGLPVELKAIQESSLVAPQSMPLAPEKVRQAASRLATKYIGLQKGQFKKWGILGDWDTNYTTMDYAFESNELLVFQSMVESGLIYRGLRPVYWSPSSKTALAESELEYADRKSHSAYYSYPLLDFKCYNGTPLPSTHLCIWTSTPWTIPSNKAVAVHDAITYGLLKSKSGDERYYIASKDQLEHVQSLLSFPTEITGVYFLGSHLLKFSYTDPLLNEVKKPIFHGAFVESNSGTGIVHMAPAHGMEDFLLCSKENLICTTCLVDENGQFTKDTPIPELRNLSVLHNGNETVLSILSDHHMLLADKFITHSYPHDWRTKGPIIVRMTFQWFVELSQIKDKLIESLASVDMSIIGKSRLLAMLTNRQEWCISRQRVWGLPIPAFYDIETDEPLMNKTTIEHVATIFKTHGSDAWWTLPDAELLAPEYRDNGRRYRKGQDTLDVWFDSGTAWTTLTDPLTRPSGSTVIADLIVEGSDQYRGWFQSMLITSVSSRNQAPYKKVLGHGFVLDEEGRKMSKSIGNVIDPDTLFFGKTASKGEFPAYGIDTIRMWVASTEYQSDIRIGKTILARLSESKDKIRNTAKFMLGNLQDFQLKDRVPYAELPTLDKYMLVSLAAFMKEIKDHYEHYAFNQVLSVLHHFAANELSSFYFDIAKDVLYADKRDSYERRSIQTVLSYILPTYCQALAPILCYTAHDIHTSLPNDLQMGISSPFHLTWLTPSPEWHDAGLLENVTVLKELRGSVHKLLQIARDDKMMNRSAEMQVCIQANAQKSPLLYDLLFNDPKLVPYLSNMLIVSHVKLVTTENDMDLLVNESRMQTKFFSNKKNEGPLLISVAKSSHAKCPRCWMHRAPSHADSALCARCDSVLSSDEPICLHATPCSSSSSSSSSSSLP